MNENAEVLDDDFDSVFKEKVINYLEQSGEWILTQVRSSPFLDSRRCHLCVAEKLCHSRFDHRSVPHVGRRFSGAVHIGEKTQQELCVQLGQFNLQWAIHQHSIFAHELVSAGESQRVNGIFVVFERFCWRQSNCLIYDSKLIDE